MDRKKTAGLKRRYSTSTINFPMPPCAVAGRGWHKKRGIGRGEWGMGGRGSHRGAEGREEGDRGACFLLCYRGKLCKVRYI